MKKFQIRFQFSETLGLEDYVSLQHNERCIELPPHNTIPRDPSRPWGKLQRRKSRLRSTRSLLYLIAKDLSCFLASLKLKNTPLTINGLEVDFNDILIVDIHRPTKGSIQPQLAILPTALAKYNP
ncbi:hypothetical protein ONZ51_g2086 [Trametes cubensis]|uniref:Uncharacterized protein n=1 Tax=Trametes cubensis TaxID=1111947 RepID=A0AAD7U2Y5_9APHY|nr:hypothetical protein ONZ51_g2086 [Trametes cubensis]